MDNWNDDRLDELSRRVDSGFTKVDERFVRVEGEMRAGFAKVEAGREADFEKLNGRFDRLQNTLLILCASFGIAMVGTVGGFIFT